MNVAQRTAGALDIIQTRELTSRERRDLTHLWAKLCWRDENGWLDSTASSLWYGFAGFLGISVLMAVNRLADLAPALSAQLALAAIGFAAAVVLAHCLADRRYRQKLWSRLRAGDRYMMTDNGVQARATRGEFSCGWTSIEEIVDDERHLIALLGGNSGFFIVKAAFEGQNIDAFGTELRRRWQERRAASGPAAT